MAGLSAEFHLGFNLYWDWIGLPLSRFKGFVVDPLSFSLVEVALQTGILISFICVTLWLPWMSRKPSRFSFWNPKALRKWSLLGPIGLLFLGMGQGAFPLSLAPSAWRKPLSKTLPHPPLAQATQDSLLQWHWQHLWEAMNRSRYFSLTEQEALVTCDRLLDSVLNRLQLPPGRKVTAIKTMGPLTSALGLIYGGPAFHDPLFGELAIISESQMPSSHFWRLHATCHETAHAKGFTREMDAELLTQSALSLSDDIRYQMLGDLLYLSKSGKSFPLPPLVREDIQLSRQRRKEVEANQLFIASMRRLAEKWNLRNSPKKYGDRDPHEAWDPNHPFYATLTEILTANTQPIHTYGP